MHFNNNFLVILPLSNAFFKFEEKIQQNKRMIFENYDIYLYFYLLKIYKRGKGIWERVNIDLVPRSLSKSNGHFLIFHFFLWFFSKKTVFTFPFYFGKHEILTCFYEEKNTRKLCTKQVMQVGWLSSTRFASMLTVWMWQKSFSCDR